MFDLSKIPLPREAVIIDGGANEGQFVELAYKHILYPNIIAIEMLPDLARALKTRHPNVMVLNCALSNYMGRGKYNRCRASQMSSLLRPAPVYQDYYPIEECGISGDGVTDVRRLDSITPILMLDHVDLIKLDLQGGELAALCGAEATLAITANLVIEVEFVQLYQDQPLADEIAAFLGDRGFEVAGSLEDHHRNGTKVAADWWFRKCI